MDDEGQSIMDVATVSVCFLRKQVKVLRRLLEESEAARAGKRTKQEDRCSHSKKVLVNCGPRDNGMFDYQCMRCGEFL